MLKTIVVGLGGRGRRWLQDVAAHPGCAVVACVEPQATNAERATAEFGVARDMLYHSLEDALNSVSADCVIDVTPPNVHHRIAHEAFKAGLHVLGEKPLSDDFDTAKAVVSAGHSAGVQHMITQNYRFRAQPRRTRELLEQGLIGKPEQCDISFYMPWADIPGSHYVEEPYMLINDMMVHHFDMLRYVLDEDPVSLQAITWNPSWGWHKGDAAHLIYFQFPDNLHATHVSCGCAVGTKTTWNGEWRIEGPKGSITWEGSEIWHTHQHRVDEPVRRQLETPEVPDHGVSILDEFIASLHEGRAPECNAADNLKSLAMVFAAIRSAREGRRIMMAEMGCP